MITLATLPQATAQEVFDQVATHLLTQGEPARDHTGVCVFLNDDGQKCAAGCLLSYEEFMNLPQETKGGNWGDVAFVTGVHDHEALIRALQRTHDRVEPERWRTELENIARNNSFEFHVP